MMNRDQRFKQVEQIADRISKDAAAAYWNGERLGTRDSYATYLDESFQNLADALGYRVERASVEEAA